MPLFVLIGQDGPEGADLRAQYRPRHLEHLDPLSKAGKVVFAGPLKDEAGRPCGSVVVFEAEDLARARALAERDPYVVHGVFAHVEVFETTRVFPA